MNIRAHLLTTRFRALSALSVIVSLAVTMAASTASSAAFETQEGQAAENCAPSDLQLSAIEGTDVGTVTLEVSAAVARPCAIVAISAQFIDAGGRPLPDAQESALLLNRRIGEPAEYVLATLAWTNWCSEHGDAFGPLGATVTVNGTTLLVPRLASIPFCLDPRARLAFAIEVAPDPSPLTVPGSLLDAAVNVDSSRTWAQLIDHLLVYAGDQPCGVLSLVDPGARNEEGDAVFFLGRPRQSPLCSTAGALVCLEKEARGQEAGWTLVERFRLQPGQALMLKNFAPDPPQDPGPQPTCRDPEPTPRAPAAGTGPATTDSEGTPALILFAVLTAVAGLLAAYATGRK